MSPEIIIPLLGVVGLLVIVGLIVVDVRSNEEPAPYIIKERTHGDGTVDYTAHEHLVQGTYVPFRKNMQVLTYATYELAEEAIREHHARRITQQRNIKIDPKEI